MTSNVNAVMNAERKELERWKEKTAVELSEFSPKRIETIISDSVSKHLPKYKSTFSNALKKVEAMNEKQRTAQITDAVGIGLISFAVILFIFGACYVLFGFRFWGLF